VGAQVAGEIPDEDELLIRLPPDQVVWDENLNRHRASGEALDDENLSSYSSAILTRIGLTPKDVLEGHPESWSVAGILASVFKQRGLKLNPDPDNSGPRCGPAHVTISGPKPSKARSKMAKQSRLVVTGDVEHCKIAKLKGPT